MDNWKEIAKAARDGFEEGRGASIGRPPVNTTLSEIYVELIPKEHLDMDMKDMRRATERGAAIWEDIGIRFVLRKYWYQIRWAIWKWRNR